MRPRSARTALDPAATMPGIRRYERRITHLFQDYKQEALRILDVKAVSYPLEEEIRRIPNTKGIQGHLDQAALVKVRIPGDLIIDTETEKAYRHGMAYGDKQIRTYGRGIQLGKGPIDPRIITALKDRSLADLKGITDATSNKIMRIITDGILKDRDFKDITRDIVRAVDAVGIVRATTMVRTETQKAVNAGARGRYAQAGVQQLERLEARDEKTCDDWPFRVGGRTFTGCGELDGEVFTPDDAAEIDSQTHPNCRGTWIPHIVPPGKAEEAPPAPVKTPPREDIQKGAAGLAASMRRIEDGIRARQTETLVALDENGLEVFRKDGTRNHVPVEIEEGRLIGRAGYMTHNHPSDVSFSPGDMDFAAFYGLKEIRACSANYDHVMTPGPAGWPDREYLRHVVRVADREQAAIFWPQIDSGAMTLEKAQAQHWHEVWKKVAAQLKLNYTRTPR